MSESVKIGGIGKNPAIDKINRLNAVDVKGYAAKKMEEILLHGSPEEQLYGKSVPMDFSRGTWEGKAHDGK